MSDVFISYARTNYPQARAMAKGLADAGYDVWIDDDLPAHRAFSTVIEENLRAAKAVLVLWSKDACASRWVPAEADIAYGEDKLVQISIDGSMPPLPFNRIHCERAPDWNGELNSPAWQKILASIADLARPGASQLRKPEEVSGKEPVAHMGTRAWDIAAPEEKGLPRELPASVTTKPSIAVLPFQQVGDTSDAWFPDAVADEITVALARFGRFFVLSSISALRPENRDRPPEEVAAELGARYVLSGKIQRSDQRVRFIAHLDDVIEARRVWSDRFDEDLDDIFELQDRIARTVAKSIGVSINDAEAYRARHQPSRDIRDIYYQANLLIQRIDPKSIATVLALAKRALEIEPENSWAAAMAALANGFQFLLGWTSDREASRERTIHYCEIALKDSDADERVFGLCGPALNCVGHKIELAHQLTDKAIDINPCDAGTLFWGSWMDVTAGNSERGIERARTSLAVNPKSGIGHLIAIPHAIGLIQLGRYEEAADMLTKVVEVSPQGDALAALVIALVKLDRIDEAKAIHARLNTAGRAIGGLALMQKPEHKQMVEECLAVAGGG
ncbi:TIR domain-containing protein [Qipengyuania aquimaris]|uniref:TIR domain-containing protein n=1 Tax=Qipengyuania aquimaris TaxID=255984 RepID=UPI001C97BC54|nr:TIR domain-containing protein [Qipengyuania aquimaris]MBY6127403.1 TIR domain-containing protein [Qipengyuania aquimaris]